MSTVLQEANLRDIKVFCYILQIQTGAWPGTPSDNLQELRSFCLGNTQSQIFPGAGKPLGPILQPSLSLKEFTLQPVTDIFLSSSDFHRTPDKTEVIDT